MAIYDPPDGSIDPRPRCSGDCCRSFSIEFPYQEVMEEYERAKNNQGKSEKIPDILTIGEMLVPLGIFRKQELFTCKHFAKDGNCSIYEHRPKMCRDFPGPKTCPYRNCSSHGKQNMLRRTVNWLLD